MNRVALVVCSLAVGVCVVACGGGTNSAPQQVAEVEPDNPARFADINPFERGEVARLSSPSKDDYVILVIQQEQLITWGERRVKGNFDDLERLEKNIGATRLKVGAAVQVIDSNLLAARVFVLGRNLEGFVLSDAVGREARLKEWRRKEGR